MQRGIVDVIYLCVIVKTKGHNRESYVLLVSVWIAKVNGEEMLFFVVFADFDTANLA